MSNEVVVAEKDSKETKEAVKTDTILNKEEMVVAYKKYEDTVIRLISRNEYYGHLLLQLNVSFSNSIPTAGVGIRNSKLHMFINPHFFSALLNNEKRVFLIKHELAHIILGHLGEERKSSVEDHKISNIAQDAAIHEILTEAKTLFTNEEEFSPVIVESIKEITGRDDIKFNETSEYYFNFLKEKKNELSEKFKDYQFDVHDFGDGEGGDGEGKIDPDLGKALTLEALQKAKNSCNGAGNVPGEAEITIERFKTSKMNWKAALRRYTASQLDEETRITRNRRNRRYGFIIPGKRKSFHPKVTLIVDTSGSMSMEMLDMIIAEMVKMEKQGFEITVIEADAMAQRSYPFKERKFGGFVGGGGTLFSPAFEQAKKFTPDLCIYASDMDPADDPPPPPFPVLWLRTANGHFKPTFGRILDLF